MRRVLSLVVVLAAAAAAGGRDAGCDPSLVGHITFAKGEALTVRIADDQAERAQGLMGLRSLSPDEGMAFVFDGPTDETFWMKDTLIPLSIAFVSGDRIVGIREMLPCASDPCPTYASPAPYTYAMEANGGWFSGHGLGEGDRVRSFDEPCG